MFIMYDHLTQNTRCSVFLTMCSEPCEWATSIYFIIDESVDNFLDHSNIYLTAKMSENGARNIGKSLNSSKVNFAEG